MISFGILTLGCKVNSYESEAIINNLCSHGWLMKSFDDVCDVYIVNTCTVTSVSDQKSRQMLHQARRSNPNGIVVAVGCFVQYNTISALDNADIVIGTVDKLKVYELVNSYLETRKQINAVTDVLNNPKFEEMKVSSLKTHTRGFIKIQDGCENYCSYCAISYARGKIRSRNPLSIIEEINDLCSQGVKEIILAGINTGTYGQDLGNINLAMLIELIMNETSIYRVRLSSIELMEITDELLDTIFKYKSRIANHLHIPLQGGCDSVLQRMNRRYTTLQYQEKIDKIRTMFPDIALTTDVLAGFVGETEEEFISSLNFIEKIGFFEMHVFPYSRRVGTKADQMDGHLDNSIKKARAKKISEIAGISMSNYINKFLGQCVDVLVETTKNGYYHGHTSNYLDVYFKSDLTDLDNKIVKVLLSSSDGKIVYGRMENLNV